jgi:carbamoyltransferase
MTNVNLLSINFNHDGSAAIISEGRIKAFVNTERFSKKKKHPGIRKQDLDNLLKQSGLALEDIGIVLLCNIHNMDSPDVPFLYGSNLKETWLPFWVNQTLDRVILDGVQLPCIINPDHHLLHCSLAYFTSSFEEAICFSWDPTGYGVFIGRNKTIQKTSYRIKQYNSCNWYANVATNLFGTGIMGAGKVMGLAPYGSPGKDCRNCPSELANLHDLYEVSENGNAIYVNEGEKSFNATLAFNIQHIMEVQLTSILKDLAGIARDNNISANLCLGGGGALNSVANQLAFQQSEFKQIHIHPASGDDGTAIGAGLWYWFDRLQNERRSFANREMMYSVLSYDDAVENTLRSFKYKGSFTIEPTMDYISLTAKYLSEGKIIGWFQNSSEIGPRALGNRSILADPRNPDMKRILNARVKFREGFRPFAPSVLNEYADEWFGLSDSPFMLRVCNVLKDDIPAVSHVDQTARIQTVRKEDNFNYYQLIDSFNKITGVPVLINTSFNIKGEPIVETPEDAIECFLNTELDVLVFKNIVLTKPGHSNN